MILPLLANVAASCATVTVSTATPADIPALEADAACFGQREAEATVRKEAEEKARVSARRSRILREDKAEELRKLPPPGFVPSPTLDGGAPWTAPFEISYGLAPAGLPNIYDANKGAFRFVCGGKGRLVYDDPVLYPGKPGASHLHQPWGNADFSASTTPESLRQSAVTDCNDTPFSLNRSLYWMPALVNDQGEAIQPDLVVVYYKQWASDSLPCTPGSPTFVGRCVTIPNQIRFIFGWNPKAPDAPVKGASWYCTAAAGLADRQRGGHFANLADVFAAGCRAGDTLTANTLGPNCWDGKHLDMPDHRSHVAYAEHRADGRYTCPVTHPFTIPQEENKAQWTVTADMIADDGTPRIGLSSDMMKAGAKPGETLHADYMEAWDEAAKAMWFDNCIQKRLSCNGGNLGNGFKLIGAEKPPYGWVNPAPRVALPKTLHHVP